MKRGENLYKHGLRKHPLFTVWINMRSRCYNKKATGYEFYGEKGVMVCDEWRQNFKPFYDWAIANGWEAGLEIDKDIKGDGFLYSPENCCFVTGKKNKNNTKRNRYLNYNGEVLTMHELADKYNLPYTTFQRRLFLGWSIEDAISTPIRAGNYKRLTA